MLDCLAQHLLPVKEKIYKRLRCVMCMTWGCGPFKVKADWLYTVPCTLPCCWDAEHPESRGCARRCRPPLPRPPLCPQVAVVDASTFLQALAAPPASSGAPVDRGGTAVFGAAAGGPRPVPAVCGRAPLPPAELLAEQV